MVSLPVSTGTDAELSMHTVSGRNNPRPVHATDVCLNVKPLPSGRSVEDVLHQRTALINPHFIEETRGEFLHSTAPVRATVLHLYNHPYRIPRPRGHRAHAVAVGMRQGGGRLYQALVGPVGRHGIRPAKSPSPTLRVRYRAADLADPSLSSLARTDCADSVVVGEGATVEVVVCLSGADVVWVVVLFALPVVLVEEASVPPVVSPEELVVETEGIVEAVPEEGTV